MEGLTSQNSRAELTQGKQRSLLKDIRPLPSFLAIQREAKCNFCLIFDLTFYFSKNVDKMLFIPSF